MIHGSIQNLIFDLGGVIMDLHVEKTHQAFAQWAGCSVQEVREKVNDASFFVTYEKGMMDDAEFREAVRRLLGKNLTDGEIDKAWNAMLGEIPIERLQLLKRLRGDFNVFLLSNTNSIHLVQINKIVRSASAEPGLTPFFDKDYYSHVLKMRKPDEEIFRHVLDQNQLVPGHTLFLDDHLPNLEGAAKTGINTFHVQSPNLIFSLFS